MHFLIARLRAQILPFVTCFSTCFVAAGCGSAPPPEAKIVPIGKSTIDFANADTLPGTVTSGSDLEVTGRAEVPDRTVSLQVMTFKIFQGQVQVSSTAATPRSASEGVYLCDFKVKVPKDAGKYTIRLDGLLGWTNGDPASKPADSKILSRTVDLEVKK